MFDRVKQKLCFLYVFMENEDWIGESRSSILNYQELSVVQCYISHSELLTFYCILLNNS